MLRFSTLVAVMCLTTTFTFAQITPGGLPGGQARILPDYIPHIDVRLDKPDNSFWETYQSGPIGTDAFVVSVNVAVVDTDSVDTLMSAGAVIAPVDGSAPLDTNSFWVDDFSAAYLGQINETRQSGNPGRAAGDARPGGTFWIGGMEANPHFYEEFQADNRWDLGLIYGDGVSDGRYGAVQGHNYDAGTNTSAPAFRANSGILKDETFGDLTGNGQIGRFGGEITVLDDGNAVVLIDDRSGLFDAGTAATAIIMDQEGNTVVPTQVLSTGDPWSNMTSTDGGFAVRRGNFEGGQIFFYDNNGDLRGQISQNGDADEVINLAGGGFDGGRGDGTRIGGHVNHQFVFLAGTITRTVDEQPQENVWVAAFNATDVSFVNAVNVNELNEDNGGTDSDNFLADFDRVAVATDALGRLTVAWDTILPGVTTQNQWVGRHLAFDATDGSFAYQSPSYFVFENHQTGDTGEAPIRTTQGSVAMTTREVCFGAKGEVNTDNDPSQGANTPGQVNVITIVAHPDPQDDPTPPAGTKVKPGDVNLDGGVDISDPVADLNFQFAGIALDPCLIDGISISAGGLPLVDFNGDGGHDISDPVASLNWQFAGGGNPPHVLGLNCTTFAIDCDVDCSDG